MSCLPFASLTLLEGPWWGSRALYPLGSFECKAADRRLSLGCVGAFQSAEWALVKRLTDTDLVVDQALNDQQSRK